MDYLKGIHSGLQTEKHLDYLMVMCSGSQKENLKVNNSGIQTGWHLEKYLGYVMVIHWGCRTVIQMDGRMVIHWDCQKLSQTDFQRVLERDQATDFQREKHLVHWWAHRMVIRHLAHWKVMHWEKYLDYWWAHWMAIQNG